MSIALGLVARGGLVLAADSQITLGDQKISQGKTRGMYCSDPQQDAEGEWHVQNAGSMVIAGAGQPDGYVYALADRLLNGFRENQASTADNLRSELEQVLVEFHTTHVVPYLPLAAVERPNVDLLVGYTRNGTFGMWGNDFAVMNQVSFYRACGIGKAQATAMLETLYRLPQMDLAGTAVLASLILFRVKEHNIYCGNDTDLWILDAHSRFFMVPRQFSTRLEASWLKYGRTIEAAAFRSIAGSPLTDESNNEQALRQEWHSHVAALRTMLTPPERPRTLRK